MLSKKFIYISAGIIIAGLLTGLGYFLGIIQGISQKEAEKAEATFSQNNEAGAVGEVMVKEKASGEESPLVSPTMPPAIFSTAGTVAKIESDRVIIRGEGTNFADGVSRNITAIFTADTFTFVSYQAFRWQGLAGLKQLQPGMKILIESQENLRGKTEFQAKIVNIL